MQILAVDHSERRRFGGRKGPRRVPAYSSNLQIMIEDFAGTSIRSPGLLSRQGCEKRKEIEKSKAESDTTSNRATPGREHSAF